MMNVTGSFKFGGDGETRTLTPLGWNLNPVRLPIPPRPQVVFQAIYAFLMLGII